MTLSEYQTALQALYRGDGDTPSDGDTKWNHREYLLAASINLWDNQNILWNELWTELADASTGDKTVNASDLEYTMPTNFRSLGAWVRTTSSAGNNTFYQIIQPETAEQYKNTSTNACFVTGNKSAGYTLTFLKQPAVGETINYPYYKEPTNPTSTTDVIEMSDPYFAVYFALGKLHEQDGAGDRAKSAYSIAEQKLKVMKTKNMLLPHYQPNGPVKTLGGFGTAGSWGISRYGDQL